MSIRNLLNVGRHALGAYQGAMEQASQNAANVATQGYSRRRGTLANLGFGRGRTIASGVQFSNPRRIVDRLSNASVRNSRAQAAYQRGRESSLRSVEAIVAPSEGGLSDRIDNLFNAFSRLASKPGGLAERRALQQAGRSLASDLQVARAQLEEMQRPLTGLAQDQIQQVNHLNKQIAHLNGQIRATEAGEIEASDLRDERDRLLDDLAGLAGTSVVEHKDSTVTVSLPGGLSLVSGDQYSVLSSREVDGQLRITITEQDGGPEVTLRDGAIGGEVAGLLEARNTDVGGAIAELDALAYGLARGINVLHTQGFGMDGQDGRGFFADPLQLEGAAAAIRLSDEVDADVDAIAATRYADRVPGGSDLALELADLRDNPMAELDGQTVEEALTNLQVGIGQSLASAKADREAAEAQERTFGSIRESTRGVNLDEELADLMSFQRGFQAAGRVVQVADEMMETVLGMI